MPLDSGHVSLVDFLVSLGYRSDVTMAQAGNMTTDGHIVI